MVLGPRPLRLVFIIYHRRMLDEFASHVFAELFWHRPEQDIARNSRNKQKNIYIYIYTYAHVLVNTEFLSALRGGEGLASIGLQLDASDQKLCLVTGVKAQCRPLASGAREPKGSPELL